MYTQYGVVYRAQFTILSVVCVMCVVSNTQKWFECTVRCLQKSMWCSIHCVVQNTQCDLCIGHSLEDSCCLSVLCIVQNNTMWFSVFCIVLNTQDSLVNILNTMWFIYCAHFRILVVVYYNLTYCVQIGNTVWYSVLCIIYNTKYGLCIVCSLEYSMLFST